MIFYTGNVSYSVPDVNIVAMPGDLLQANNGFGHTLTVQRNGKWIGWCCVEETGFATACEWVAANGTSAIYQPRVT